MNPVDQSARDTALMPTKSLIVSAPAGSGKTFLLTRRILNLLMHVEHPGHVLAITFTKKAAHEMMHRLIQCLTVAEEPIAKAVLNRSKEKGWKLLENTEQLNIMTIDSYCSWLLTRQKQGTVPSILQSPSHTYQDVVYQYYNNNCWNSSQKHLLEAFNGQYSVLESLLVDLLARRDQWADTMDVSDLQTSCHRGIECIIHEHLSQLASDLEPISESIEEMVTLHTAISNTVGEASLIDNTNSISIYQSLASILLSKSGDPRKKLNKNQGVYPKSICQNHVGLEHIQNNFKSICASILEFLSEQHLISALFETLFLPSAHNSQDIAFLNDLTIVLNDLTLQLDELFNHEQCADFTYIALKAIHALRHDETLQRFCHEQIHHVLIDEFQDTSMTQYHLLEALVVLWPQYAPRTLFVVGDPMQSIYRFRQADVRLFLKLQDQPIGHIQLEPIFLQCNFRSSTALIEQINPLFTAILPPSDMPMVSGIKYRQATPTQSAKPHHKIYIYHEQSTEASSQATLMLEIIQSLLSQHPSEKIAVLVQARSHLKHIIPVLESQHIPFNAIDIYPIVNLSSIKDLTALLSALIDPTDRLSWFTVLRSPLCGLNIESLIQIPNQPFPQAISSLALTPPQQELLNKLYLAITQATQYHANPVHQAWFVWQQLLGPQIYPSDQQPAIDTWLSSCLALHEQGLPLHWNHLIDYFSRSFTSRIALNSQIELLTAHKSKGLEYDHVIIPHLEKKKPSASTPLFFTEPSQHTIIQPTFTENETNNNFFKRLNKRRDINESMRLLYVACTRAKSTLHLIGHMDEKPNTNTWLEAVWQHRVAHPGIKTITCDSKPSQTQHQCIPLLSTPQHCIQTIKTTPIQQRNIHSEFGTHLHFFMQYFLHPSRMQKWTYYLATQCNDTELYEKLIQAGHQIIETHKHSSNLQWIMSSYLWSRNEFPQVINQQQIIIDRVFIEKDTLWVIDYKFPQHHQTDHKLIQDYHHQIFSYAQALRGLAKQIRGALYLPLEDRLIEVHLDQQSTQIAPDTIHEFE